MGGATEIGSSIGVSAEPAAVSVSSALGSCVMAEHMEFRALSSWRISDYHGWTASMPGIAGDARKYYLANHGPLMACFTVFEDLDSYAGGVFRHVTGNARGEHG